MTRKRLSQILYMAVYMVVRRSAPLPSVDEFLKLKVGTVLSDSAPSDWPSFWEEALTAVLMDLLRQCGYRIDELSPELFSRRNRSMSGIRDWMAKRVMPLEPVGGQSGKGEGERDGGERPGEGQGQGGKNEGRQPKGRQSKGRKSPERKAKSGKPPGRSGRHSAPASRLLLLWLALTVAPLQALWSLAGASTAALKRTPSSRIESARYPYEIAISFETARGRTMEVPREAALDAARYDLRSSCNPEEPVRVQLVVWRGVGDLEDHTTGALLFADLDPECTYTLRMFMPQLPSEPIEVTVEADVQPKPAARFVRFMRFVDRHVWGTLDMRTLEGADNNVGADFRIRLGFPVIRRKLWADAIRLRLEADGMISVHKETQHVHNALDFALAVSWLRTYTLPAPSGGGCHVHALGLQLAPVGFESDRNFHVVDYTASPKVSFSIPFIDWPLFFWHQLIRMPRGFLPPTATVGYTFVHRVREEGGALDDRHRLDGEVTAVVPLLRPLDLAARYRCYYDLDQEHWEDIWELSWRWYIAKDSRIGFLVKLVHGALPPLFEEAELVGLGFGVGL